MAANTSLSVIIIYREEMLTLMAENMGGTCQISPEKDATAFFMSSSLICSQGSR